MRKPRTGEVIGTVAGLGLGVALGGVVTRGLTDSEPSEGVMQVPRAATIVNTENRKGVPIGVRTYASPYSTLERGVREEAAPVDAVCVELNGRLLTDTDVPAGEPTDRGNDWYLLTATTDPSRQEWVNTSYVELAPAVGAAALDNCDEIGLAPPRN